MNRKATSWIQRDGIGSWDTGKGDADMCRRRRGSRMEGKGVERNKSEMRGEEGRMEEEPGRRGRE